MVDSHEGQAVWRLVSWCQGEVPLKQWPDVDPLSLTHNHTVL